ncbi:MAG: NAD(P)-dependent oxidoreductase [Acidimicrobiia bacterium]|nr:NAD(P)-dependent oxidoreductase [Acidimicrobiia bacterium]
MENEHLAVIGLGLMGSRMSERLLGDGFKLRGFDTSSERLAEFEQRGGQPTGSPSEAVQGCWAALLSLPTSDVSREVCLGRGGIAEGSEPPLIVYDTTTGRPQDAVEISAALAEQGVAYCDSTVSGNGEIAQQGKLVVMMGGQADAYRAGRPIFESIGRSHHHVGPPGSGSRMKLIVNHVLTIHRMALGEALVVAELSDMDLEATLEVLKDSLAYSKAMDAWGERMIAGDHEEPFARLRQSHKDSRLIVDHGLGLGAPMDLVAVVRDALAEGESTGLADLDNSAVVEVVRRRAGIGRVD